MPTFFESLIFFPDGKEPVVSQIDPATLSPKWSAICADILDQLGPVFKYNMGSTLSHFDIEMAGPFGRLIVHDTRCFDFWIIRAPQSEQDRSTVQHFTEFLHSACKIPGSLPTAATLDSLRQLESTSGLIFFDYCQPEIDENQKDAIAQLGVHLGHAYLEYSEPGA
jgi:hypothetical protein